MRRNLETLAWCAAITAAGLIGNYIATPIVDKFIRYVERQERVEQHREAVQGAAHLRYYTLETPAISQ